jgi:fibro-slime domain-containing protein
MKRYTLALAAIAVLAGSQRLYAAITLTGTVRDFQMWSAGGSNPDFENVVADDRGIVMSDLGSDGKPVYANPGGSTPTTHGQAYFDQWYNDTPGVNINIPSSITLADVGSGIYRYDSNSFFPIDNLGWGNQGQPHNYSFTYELHTQFTYQPGQNFSFTGDDDVWVFINNTLAIDLGGVHSAESASVNLDTLGLTSGNAYDLDLFFAERHTVDSDFAFDTSIVLQQPATVPEPATIIIWSLLGALGMTIGWWRRRKAA